MENQITLFRDLLMNYKSKSNPKPRDYAASDTVKQKQKQKQKQNQVAMFRNLLIKGIF